MHNFRPRIIPCLLLKDGGLVKSNRFRDYVYLGDPINAVKIFNDFRADELIFLDIDATRNGSLPDFSLLERITNEAYMPFSYGGGISSLKTVDKLISLGVEKVIINSAARKDQELIRKISSRYGSQAVVCAIDVVSTKIGYRVYDHLLQKSTRQSPVTLIKQLEFCGAGEIFIQAVDRDGCRKGYDLVLLNRICRNTALPVIACGGVGSSQDMTIAHRLTDVSGLAAGSKFVYSGSNQAVLMNYPDKNEQEEIAVGKFSFAKLNILVLCNPGDTHNLNWFRYMSTYANLFVMGSVHDTQKMLPDDLKLFEELGICLLEALPDYSLSKPMRIRSGSRQIENVVKSYNIHVAQIQYATDYCLWHSSLGVPYIITTRGSDVFVDIPRIISKPGSGPIWNKLYRQAFEKAAFITSTSERQKEQICNLFKIDDGIVVRTGVDISSIAAALQSTEFILPDELMEKQFIFCPRYLLPLYQNELIVKAFMNLDAQIRAKYKLVFVGSRNDFESEYEQQFRKLCNDQDLDYHIYKKVPEGLMWTLFQKAAVSVMVPKSDGTPVSGMEALAVNCPLILGNVAYDNQIFLGASLVMKTSDQSELAELLKIAMMNYPAAFVSKGYLSVRKYGNRAVEMNLLKLLFFSLYWQKK